MNERSRICKLEKFFAPFADSLRPLRQIKFAVEE